ncbi:hypothetical protein RFZ45_09470, partial [Acinetobacter baumannii]|nr:hypothetical protein [Acinetobacter baumannii]
ISKGLKSEAFRNIFDGGNDLRYVISIYIFNLVEKGVDSIVLGCTHYPLLKRTIGEEVGMEVKLVNPARETAIDLKNILIERNLLNTKEELG